MDPDASINAQTIKNVGETSAAHSSNGRTDGFALHQMRDREHGNVVACVIEHPATWQARSEVVWNYADGGLPIKTYAQLYNPHGAESVEFLPAEMFFWMREAWGSYRQGQSVRGLTFMPPTACVDALKAWVVPKFRSHLPGLRVTREGPVSFRSRLGPSEQGIQGEEGCITLEYVLNGNVVVEEIYGVRSLLEAPFQGLGGKMVQTNWGFPILFSFRAEKGQLDANRPLFWQIAATRRRNPAWEALSYQVMEQLQALLEYYPQLNLQLDHAQIRALLGMRQGSSANNDAILAGFARQRQAAHSTRAAHRPAEGESFGRAAPDDASDRMRGVGTVYDPYGGKAQQDANYLYHWTDGQGNYQHSDDPFFDPSIGANEDWTLMPPVQR